MKCLQKDADRRYQTMIELERAVQEVLARDAQATSDDVATFVRTLMGDRGQKRRAQLRDAVRMLDERAAVLSSDGPMMHEGVSEMVLTEMRSGVAHDLVPTRPGTPGALADLLSDSLVLSSPTHLPFELPAGCRRSGVLVAASVGLAAALGVGALLLGHGWRRAADPLPAPPEQPPPAAADPTLSAAAPAPTIAPRTADPGPDASVEIAFPPEQDAKGSARPARQATRVSSGGRTPTAPTGASSVKSSGAKWVPWVKDPGF
jgi:serine/threonine-protein kinase